MLGECEHSFERKIPERIDAEVPFDQQVDDPGLLLRVEHIPEFVELGQSGGQVAGTADQFYGQAAKTNEKWKVLNSGWFGEQGEIRSECLSPAAALSSQVQFRLRSEP